MNQLNVDEYGFDGLNSVRKHLSYLKLAITGSLLKLKLNQTNPPEDLYVTDELNASDLLLKTLEEMKEMSNRMEGQLLSLSTGTVSKLFSFVSGFAKIISLSASLSRKM